MTDHARNAPPPRQARAMYCLDCRYILNGLAADQCPECGRRFSLNDRDSYLHRDTDITKRWPIVSFLASVLVVLGTINVAFTLMALFGNFESWELFWIVLINGAINGGLCLFLGSRELGVPPLP